MQRIGSHISELLFDHDCVIVPSLGGFLASNEHARMLPNRILYPPYRRIAFNVYLKQNDGLLANHLVETEGISYTAANTLLEEFTFECIQNLEQGKKVSIEEVGTLYFDHEKNIQFEAYRNINHRKDSFGMEPVHIIPVQRDQAEEKRKPVQPVKTLRPSKPATRQLISKKGKRYIGVAAAVAAIVWFSASLYVIVPKKYEATSLNPFDSQSLITTEPIKDSAPALISETETQISADTEPTQNDTSLVAENVIIQPETVSPVIVKPEVIQTPQSAPVNPEPISSTGTKHYIIAGVFSIRENALATLARLQSAGFKNAQIIEANGKNYVSYEGFSDLSAATALADSLHKSNQEGWIWKH